MWGLNNLVKECNRPVVTWNVSCIFTVLLINQINLKREQMLHTYG